MTDIFLIIFAFSAGILTFLNPCSYAILPIYFTKYTGLSVPEITKFRKLCTESSIDFTVTKNTLTKIAAKNAGLENKFDDGIKNLNVEFDKNKT